MDRAMSPARFGLARMSALELVLVRGLVLTTRPRLLRSTAVALSWLGNGWAYLAIGLGAVVAAGVNVLPALAVGALNAGLLHCMYPAIKRHVARPRPYRRDATLTPLLRVLDEHSFPSGHAMTLSAALVPLVVEFRQALVVAVVIWALMAWARLACAHHYPSDVAAGALLGVCVSYPISLYALAASPLGS